MDKLIYQMRLTPLKNLDELFYVIEGSFFLETEDKKTQVNEGEFIIVLKVLFTALLLMN